MKKLIIVLIVLVLLLSAATFEQIYTKKVLTDICNKMETISTEIDKDQENINKESTLKMVDEIIEGWNNKYSKVFEVCITHTLINEFGYKLVSLRAHIVQNDYNMADTDIFLIRENCTLLLDMNTPTLSNIF